MTEPSIWPPIMAGFGGALIGAFAALLGGWMQRKGERKTWLAANKRDAYARMLTASAMVVHMADSLRLTKGVRSGLIEGIDVTTRARRPVDPLEIYTFVRRDFEPLYHAWADVWAVGSPEAVRLANDLLNRAGQVLGVNTEPGERHRGAMWWVRGEAWTDAQLEAIRREVAALAEARRQLGELARKELRIEVADLFASSESPQTSVQRIGG